MALAQYLESIDRLDEAAAEYEAVVKATPDDVFLQYRLAGLYEKKGDKEKALEIQKKLLEKYPNNSFFKEAVERLEGKAAPAPEGEAKPAGEAAPSATPAPPAEQTPAAQPAQEQPK